MAERSEAAIRRLSERLGVEITFLKECLEEEVIEIHGADGLLDLGEGTTLHLRRLQRICHVFSVDLSVALLLSNLSRRAAGLQRELDALKSSQF